MSNYQKLKTQIRHLHTIYNHITFVSDFRNNTKETIINRMYNIKKKHS